MPRTTLLITLVLAGLAGFAQAPSTNAPPPAELRPIQKAMQARQGWMKSMAKNLGTQDLAAVAKDAGDLAAQADKAAGGIDGERKDLTLKLAMLARAAAEAAGKGDAEGVKSRLGDLKGTCAACHDKYREKAKPN